MKYIIPLLLFFPTVLNAQVNWTWTNVFGGNGSATALQIETDSNYNAYILGVYDSSITIGSFVLTANGTKSFLMKVDSAGNVYWAQNLPILSSMLAADKNGNCYIYGTFTAIINYGNSSLISNGKQDLAIFKYNSSGNLIWGKSMGSAEAEMPKEIITDNTGNIIIAGLFDQPFSADTHMVQSEFTGHKGFIVKMDSSGNTQWTRSTPFQAFWNLAVLTSDTKNNIYYSTILSGQNEFGNNISATTLGVENFVVAKYSESGNTIWAKASSGTFLDHLISMDTDDDDNIYIGGLYYISTQFDTIALTSPTSSDDMFLAKIDTAGNFIWVTHYGGNGLDAAVKYKILNEHFAYMYGVFEDTLVLGADTLIADSVQSAFVAMIDSLGNPLWAAKATWNVSLHTGDLSIGGDGSLFLAGFSLGAGGFKATADSSVFIAKKSVPQSPVLIKDLQQETSFVKVYPNPVTDNLTFDFFRSGRYQIEIFDINGKRQIYYKNMSENKKLINLSKYSSGIYFIKVKGEDDTATFKIMKQ